MARKSNDQQKPEPQKPIKRKFNLRARKSNVSTLKGKPRKNQPKVKQKRTKAKAKNNNKFFILQKKDQNCYYDTLQVKFSTLNEQQQLSLRKFNTSKLKVNVPVFNKDCKYWKPGFILADEVQSQEQGISQDYVRFHERLEQENNKNSKISQIVQLPTVKKPFCKICNIKIEDYNKHSKDVSHLQNLRNSLGQNYILAHIEKYYG